MSFCLLITSRMSKLRSGFDTRPSSWSGMPNNDLFVFNG
jgi:hypothetical protein